MTRSGRLLDLVSDDAAIRFGRALGVLSMVTGLASIVIFIALGEFDAWYEEWGVHNALGGFLFGLILFLTIPRQPRNGAVWALGWSGVFQSVFQALAASITVWLVVDRYGSDAVADYRSIGDLPFEIEFFSWLGEWSWIPALGLMMCFAFLLFPDGRLPSPRWRIVFWLAAITIAGATIGMMTADLDASSPDELPPVAEVFMPFVGIAVLASVASLFFRYRHAEGDQRHQLRWVAFGASVFGVLFVTSLTLDVAGPTTGLSQLTSLITLPLLTGSYAVAVLKYRLYDIDIVISKSVAYLGLAAVISALYAAVVVGPLLVIGKTDDGGPGLLLPIVATAVVAVLFEPVRSRMQRWANRLVYGDRATPHEVLSRVTARLSEAGNGTEDLARLLAEGTGADQAVVWLRNGDLLQAEGMWSTDAVDTAMPLMTRSLVSDEYTEAAQVRHEDVSLGALSIAKPHNDPVTAADRELLADVAAGAGLLLRNIRLNRQLEERANDVRESRRRLIAAQDKERHRLERDLHDGAQQQVVALKVKLGIAKTIAEREGAVEIAARIIGLAEETQGAVDALRAVAHGIYPPLLESEGLETALRAMERSSSIPLTVETSGLERYARPVEETTYFCVLETVERARMAGAKRVQVGLAQRNGDLVVELDLDGETDGLDLTAVTDRLDAAEGTFRMAPTSHGTELVVALPARRLELA